MSVDIGASVFGWTEANQEYLVAALDSLRVRPERHAANGGAAATLDRHTSAQRVPDQERGDDGAEPTRPVGTPALETLCAAFGLTRFERDIVLLCAGVELDGSFARLCAAAQGDATATSPTFGLALAALPDAHWSAITPVGPLRRWRLVGVSGPGLTTSPLRLEERVLHYLVGIEHLDERLEGLMLPLGQHGDPPPSHRRVADRLVGHWLAQVAPGSEASTTGLSPVQLCGPDRGAQRAVAGEACRAVGLRPFVVLADAVPSSPHDQDEMSRLWERDAILGGCALIVDCHGDDAPDASHVISAARFVGRIQQPAIVLARDPLQAIERTAARLDVERPGAGEQRDGWAAALGSRAALLDGALDRLVGQFDLGPEDIRAACADLTEDTMALGPDVAEQRLWDASRRQTRPRLDDLAQRIEPVATWVDLVLPEAQRRTLREMATHARRRTTVYQAWGFASKGLRGLGISALFTGASGTGKTMAAEVLANELRLDLYRIDLSSVVSKYIGETEKNLRRVFDAAEQGGAILLFDEADALFGKRSEVRDSHDRYANIEVSYLLQRMEAYRGLAILTTNLKSALDPAFLRRIRFVVQFPFPNPAERAEIWRRIFPSSTPTDGLDVATLARLNVAGGNIRNIALGAAFLAADDGQPVGMSHLLRATRSEYAKLERPLTRAEIGGWE